MADEIQEKIAKAVQETPVLLFVKGSPSFPMCGFSKGVMEIFQEIEVPFKTVDVLEDPRIREGVKAFTSWPTIPQVFVGGEFIGGFDIVRELFEKGELETTVKKALEKK